MSSTADPSAVAIIVAGGTGQRVGVPSGKQMVQLLGEPMLVHTVRAFDRASLVRRIVLVCHEDRVAEYRGTVLEAVRSGKPLVAVAGGATRQDSVAAGLAEVGDDEAFVAVHDGARPLITSGTVDDAVGALVARPDLSGLVVGHRSYDTLKIVDENAIVIETPDREVFWVAQTPQVFRTDALRAAFDRARRENDLSTTDDASIVEADGGRVAMFEGPRENIKVTVEADIALAEAILAQRRREAT